MAPVWTHVAKQACARACLLPRERDASQVPPNSCRSLARRAILPSPTCTAQCRRALHVLSCSSGGAASSPASPCGIPSTGRSGSRAGRTGAPYTRCTPAAPCPRRLRGNRNTHAKHTAMYTRTVNQRQARPRPDVPFITSARCHSQQHTHLRAMLQARRRIAHPARRSSGLTGRRGGGDVAAPGAADVGGALGVHQQHLAAPAHEVAVRLGGTCGGADGAGSSRAGTRWCWGAGWSQCSKWHLPPVACAGGRPSCWWGAPAHPTHPGPCTCLVRAVESC